jgi:hypothetical protein
MIVNPKKPYLVMVNPNKRCAYFCLAYIWYFTSVMPKNRIYIYYICIHTLRINKDRII